MIKRKQFFLQDWYNNQNLGVYNFGSSITKIMTQIWRFKNWKSILNLLRININKSFKLALSEF